MTADEKFFAWLDGELSVPEAEAMAERVAADPELARLAEQHGAMQSRLKAAFDAVPQMPVPEPLRSAIAPRQAQEIDFGAVRERRRPRFDLLWPQWTAVAASLAVGILVGTTMIPRGAGPIEVEDGRIYAAGALGEALDTQLASAPGDGESRVGLTFRDGDGAICRSFTEGQSAGLACRSGNRWQVRGVFASGGETGEFRMAAGMDPNLAALVESTMAGEPFDAGQEQAARASGWR